MNVIGPRSLLTLKVLWSLAIGCWAFGALMLALGAEQDVARIPWIVAAFATFCAFFASFVILMRAAIKTRSGDGEL